MEDHPAVFHYSKHSVIVPEQYISAGFQAFNGGDRLCDAVCELLLLLILLPMMVNYNDYNQKL